MVHIPNIAMLAVFGMMTGCSQLGDSATASGNAGAGTVIQVATGEALAAAVKSAAPGTRIMLAPGNYPQLFINRAIDGSSVEISGPRGARVGGVLFGIYGKGWKLSGFSIIGPPGTGAAVQITAGQNITLDNVSISGPTPDEGPENEEGLAIRAQGARAITIANSEITHVRIAFSMEVAKGIVFSGNRITNVREGININAVTGIVIRNNLFLGFNPRFDRQEHPDMIQVFSRRWPAGTSAVEISNNLLMSGLDRSIQGIFIRAEDYETGLKPGAFHHDIVVRNNIYYGSSVHGISIGGVKRFLVERNSVITSPHGFYGNRRPGDGPNVSYGWLASIQASPQSSDGKFVGNIASQVARTENRNMVYDNNFEYHPRVPADALNPGGIFAQPMTAGDKTVDKFAIRPGSRAAARQQGADAATVGPEKAERDVAKLTAEALALAVAADAAPPPTAPPG
jgi:nitrous oxidase accessory protein NosD